MTSADLTSADVERELNDIRAMQTPTIDTILSVEFAKHLDSIDPIASSRSHFAIPRSHPYSPTSPPALYLCGNSLGAQPTRAAEYVTSELHKWSTHAVEGHFNGDRPWVSIDEPCNSLIVDVVGAENSDEVATMNSLTVNLHLLLTSFYQPNQQRYKIIMEEAAFCSDHHAIRSQIELHHNSIEKCLVQLSPRSAETYLRTDDIVEAINKHGDSLAVVLLPGVQFYTGQFFDIPAITSAAHKVGAYCGWDLAHAVGNVPLSLHDWNVDFAAWCSYKYLNSGPGSIAGIFVHNSHAEKPLLKLSGWWGQTSSQRFRMLSTHQPKLGAQSYQLSNPPVLPAVCLQASLEIFKESGGLKALRQKSVRITSYLELCLAPIMQKHNIKILTPKLIKERGCQLSLLLAVPVKPILKALELEGIICDGREPNVIRAAPAPLYNTYSEVLHFTRRLGAVLASHQN